MTINTSSNKSIVLGNGSQTQFAFGFIGVAAAYISVIFTDVDGNETELTMGSGTTQYQITLNAPVQGALWGVGGTVTYDPSGTPIPTGSSLTIFRTLPLTQAISLQNQVSLSTVSNGAETGLDTIEMQLQQVSEEFGRAIVAPVSDPDTIDLVLPPAAQRAGMVLGFDSHGNVIAGAAPATGIISSAMQPVVDAASIALGQAAFGLTSINILCIESFATNVYTLNAIAPNANPAAYANGQRFTFTASDIATSAASAVVGSLPEFGIYKGFGVQAGSGDIEQGWSYTLEYSPFVNEGSPGFLLLDTPPPSQALQPFFNAVAFGADNTGATDATVACQACITAAEAVGGIVFFPGSFKLSAALVITAHVRVMGTGYQSSPISYGFGSTVANIDTRSSGFKGTVFICAPGNSAFDVSTTDSVSFESFMITYPSGGNAGIPAMLLNTAAGNVGVNFLSVVRDVLINNASIGAQINNWLDFVFDNVNFVTCGLPVICENTVSINFTGITTSATASDSTFINCTFFNAGGPNHVQLLSGGGYRFENNKFNQTQGGGTAACILIVPANLGVVFEMEPLIFIGNSFEGSAVGILAQPAAGSQANGSQWVVSGNQFFVTKAGIETVAGSTIPTWIDGMTISGNFFSVGFAGTASAFCCSIDGATIVGIFGNTFVGGTSGNGGVFKGGSASLFKIAGNHYQGFVPSPGNLSPSVPASGTPLINTTGYVVSVTLQGGSVSAVDIVPYLAGGGIGIAASSNITTVLNPGDTIGLSYSSAPAWTWLALNP